MPTYDYRCANGHLQTLRRGYETAQVPCPCGWLAQRQAVNLVGRSGFAFTPYNQRRINVDRAINAQHDLLHQAQKQGTALPDLWAMSKRRAAAIQASGEQVEVGRL